ncbi:beta family protein [Flavobacterium sp. WG21]|uniref:beta family protein n=1 Tax=Flavobacterium sp. WG21 TaxID=1229487 RepID=UPI00034698F1|nr:beta family protein [Flavobacterium sp. WG21]
MKKYYPILLSKAGELTALSKLSQTSKNDVTPVLQVLSEHISKIESFHSHWNFRENELFLDFSLAEDLSIPVIKKLIRDLQNNGVNIVPVVQENSNQRYLTLIENLIDNLEIQKICIRFSNNSGGFLNINTSIESMINQLGVNSNQLSLLLDFGFIRSTNHTLIEGVAVNVINSITNRQDYENIIVSSGSFLDNLGSLNPPGRVYRLPRYEWQLWSILQAQHSIKDTIKYSDYGTKHPIYTEANFQGSCSIKYTVIDEYVIYRGEKSSNHIDGNGQYITFATQLVASHDYSGIVFSWGDERIDFYASQLINDPDRKTGNAGSWVEISQNHHITLLTSIL